jgi:hypothetical protein
METLRFDLPLDMISLGVADFELVILSTFQHGRKR